jgi:hypothetical protein
VKDDDLINKVDKDGDYKESRYVLPARTKELGTVGCIAANGPTEGRAPCSSVFDPGADCKNGRYSRLEKESKRQWPVDAANKIFPGTR